MTKEEFLVSTGGGAIHGTVDIGGCRGSIHFVSQCGHNLIELFGLGEEVFGPRVAVKDVLVEELVEGPHPVLLQQLIGMHQTYGESKVSLYDTRLKIINDDEV